MHNLSDLNFLDATVKNSRVSFFESLARFAEVGKSFSPIGGATPRLYHRMPMYAPQVPLLWSLHLNSATLIPRSMDPRDPLKRTWFKSPNSQDTYVASFLFLTTEGLELDYQD